MNLNEWDFAIYVLNQIKTKNKVEFDIIKTLSSNSDLDFAGIVKNDIGIVYRIMNDDNFILFDQLIQVHELSIQHDLTGKKLILHNYQSLCELHGFINTQSREFLS